MALMEVCIAAHDFGPGRAREGDIIVIRKPRGEVGKKEQQGFLWLMIDESELPAVPHAKTSGKRHCISLDDIKAKYPNVDLEKIRNPQIPYQPFLNTDRQNGRSRAQVQARRLVITERDA